MRLGKTEFDRYMEELSTYYIAQLYIPRLYELAKKTWEDVDNLLNDSVEFPIKLEEALFDKQPPS